MRNRNPNTIVVLLLNIICPSFGYFYLGHTKRGVLFFSIVLLLNILIGYVTSTTFQGFFVFEVLFWGLYIFILADSFRLTKKSSSEASPASEVTIPDKKILIPLFIGLFTLNGLTSYFRSIESFVSPAGSMCPALMVGDRFIVNKRSEIKNGDVVVFKSPDDPSISFVKRIVGVPGDKISVVNKVLYINGKDVTEKREPINLTETLGCEDDLFTEKSERHLVRINNRAFDLFVNDTSLTMDFDEMQVPPDSYFIIGQNWNNSRDSRYVGPIPAKNIIGKALFVYFSSGKDGTRMNRVGLPIQ